MAAHTYTHVELLTIAQTLRMRRASEHREARGHPAGTVFTPDRQHPFQIIVHEKGATLVTNTRCGKCREQLTITEAL